MHILRGRAIFVIFATITEKRKILPSDEVNIGYSPGCMDVAYTGVGIAYSVVFRL